MIQLVLLDRGLLDWGSGFKILGITSRDHSCFLSDTCSCSVAWVALKGLSNDDFKVVQWCLGHLSPQELKQFLGRDHIITCTLPVLYETTPLPHNDLWRSVLKSICWVSIFIRRRGSRETSLWSSFPQGCSAGRTSNIPYVPICLLRMPQYVYGEGCFIRLWGMELRE